MIYYLTPIYAAGAISKKEIENIEANFKRKLNLLPKDLKNVVINSVFDHFATPTSSVIA